MTIVTPKLESTMDQHITRRSASPASTTTTAMVTRSKTGKTANIPRRYDPSPTPGPSTRSSGSTRTRSHHTTTSEELDAPLPGVFYDNSTPKRRSTIKDLKKDVETLTKENSRLQGLNNRLQGQYQSLQWAFEMHVEKL